MSTKIIVELDESDPFKSVPLNVISATPGQLEFTLRKPLGRPDPLKKGHALYKQAARLYEFLGEHADQVSMNLRIENGHVVLDSLNAGNHSAEVEACAKLRKLLIGTEFEQELLISNFKPAETMALLQKLPLSRSEQIEVTR